MERADAARKVRALLATAAPGSGATDPERDTARRLASKLAADHGLTAADLRRPPERRAPPPPPAPAPETVIVSYGFGGFSFDFSSFDDSTTTAGGRRW